MKVVACSYNTIFGATIVATRVLMTVKLTSQRVNENGGSIFPNGVSIFPNGGSIFQNSGSNLPVASL